MLNFRPCFNLNGYVYDFGVARPIAENFAFGELKMLNFRPFLSLNLYVYEFWSFARPLAYKKILHFVSYKMLDFTSFFKI